jgi:hypothetical protein
VERNTLVRRLGYCDDRNSGEVHSILSYTPLNAVNNILFKFAVDSDGFYLGDDASAAKVANQDLHGLTAVTSLGIRGLCVPLMAIVDFMGFRVTAMSLLPIGSDTLVYGSSDAGSHVMTSNSIMNEMMKRVGQVEKQSVFFFCLFCLIAFS